MMATGGSEEESAVLEAKRSLQKKKMKSGAGVGVCLRNGVVEDFKECSPRVSDAEAEEEEEISVGCPSPVLAEGSPASSDSGRTSISSATTTVNCRRSCTSEEENDQPEDDYFKPLKKLKMMKIDKVSYSIAAGKTKTTPNKRIHRNKEAAGCSLRRQSLPEESPHSGVKSFSILDILNHRPAREPGPKIVRPWDYGGLEESASSCLPPAPPPALIQIRPKSADFCSSTCSSGRSSTASDCCTSPDILNCSLASSRARQQSLATSRKAHHGAKPPNTSPLDALFQMTSKTFEELNGESSSGKCHQLFRIVYY